MKIKQNDDAYNKYVDAITPKHNSFINCANAFWVGGLICIIGQAIYDLSMNYFDCNKDDAASWIFYTNALRDLPIQYNQSTVLPLPLHLAKGLEEYLFKV